MPEWLKRIAIALRRTQARHHQIEAREAQQPAASVPAATRTKPAAKPRSRRPQGARAVATSQEALLARGLMALRLPHFLSEHDRLARHGATGDLDYRDYLLHLAEHETVERNHRRAARLIRAAGFPAAHDGADFDAATSAVLEPQAVRELAACSYVAGGDNVVALGGHHSGKTALAVALGVAACRRGMAVRYMTAAALVEELQAAFDERRLLWLYRRLDGYQLLIVDDLGPAPLSPSAAALLFEVFSRRSERRSTIVTSSLPPEAWRHVFGGVRLADAVVERLARRVHRLELGAADGLMRWLPPPSSIGAVWREEPLNAPSAEAGRERTAAPREMVCAG